MRVAIVHDWLTGLRGGERCLESFLRLYPDADIFTLLHVPGSTAPAIDARVREASFISAMPGARKYYRILLPLYPLAISRFDLSGYDLVISLSHAAAKNVRVPEGVPHISYCFTPMRYIWDQAWNYFGAATPALWPVIGALRGWDRRHSPHTRFVAISRFVAARIRCFYGSDASVLYPPVDTSWIKPDLRARQGEAFLYAGALVPYKRPELVVRAFSKLGQRLWVAGTGPEERKLRSLAGSNIEFFGHVSDQELAGLYARCRALIFPGAEDFGMVPIECMAAGRPVIALHEGALRETIAGIRPWDNEENAFPGSTGVFFPRNERVQLESLMSSVNFFMANEHRFKPEACLQRASRFSVGVFERGWDELLLKFGLDHCRMSRRFVSHQEPPKVAAL